MGVIIKFNSDYYGRWRPLIEKGILKAKKGDPRQGLAQDMSREGDLCLIKTLTSRNKTETSTCASDFLVKFYPTITIISLAKTENCMQVS